MALFGKGKRVPVEEVKNLRGQGLSDNEIIEQLKGEGYSLPQINDALAQAGVALPGGDYGESLPPPEENLGGGESLPREEIPPERPAQTFFPEDLSSRIEEITESIIDEKWDLLIAEVRKVLDWKDSVEGEINKLKNDIEKLKEDFKELHQGVLGKLGEYDERMAEVGTELKAVGKVFKEVVPEFVENVKELRSITKGMKKK